MASASSFSISTLNHLLPSSNPPQFHLPNVKFPNQFKKSFIFSPLKLHEQTFLNPTKLSAVTDEALVSEPETLPEAETAVSVSVSPSDVLTMFFQAEGTMPEAAVDTVTKALEEVEGVAGLKVRLLEGIATVELTKQTTIQSTGVASNLVEKIQGSGFKLQTLHLSFQDEDDLS